MITEAIGGDTLHLHHVGMRFLAACMQSGLGSQTALSMRSELVGSGHLAHATTDQNPVYPMTIRMTAAWSGKGIRRSELGGSGHLAPATTGAGRGKGIRRSELGGSDHLPGTTERGRWSRRTALVESVNGGSARTGNEKCRTKECAVKEKIEIEIERERVAHTYTERES